MKDFLEDKYLKVIFKEIENHGNSRWNNQLIRNAVMLKRYFYPIATTWDILCSARNNSIPVLCTCCGCGSLNNDDLEAILIVEKDLDIKVYFALEIFIGEDEERQLQLFYVEDNTISEKDKLVFSTIILSLNDSYYYEEVDIQEFVPHFFYTFAENQSNHIINEE